MSILTSLARQVTQPATVAHEEPRHLHILLAEAVGEDFEGGERHAGSGCGEESFDKSLAIPME